MPATARLVIIADLQGRVLAAELADEATASGTKEVPAVRLVALQDQRAITVDVPREMLQLPGPDLHRFFSDLQIHWPADVRLPKIKVVKKHKE